MPRLRAAALLAVAVIGCSAPSAASPTPNVTPSSAPTTSSPAPTPSPGPSLLKLTIEPTTVPLPSFATISAPSASVVWIIVGGRLVFRSTDRGNTWEQRPFPPAPNADITFIDDHEGWVSLAGSGQQCDAPGITAWHTIDGGTSWEQPAPSGLADGRCKLTLSFTDGSHGFVDSFDPQRAAAIYRTTDAGKTWSAPSGLPDPPSSGTQPGAASLQPGKVRAFGATSLVTARDTARGRTFVFRSADGGATWQFAGVGPTTENGVALVTATRWLQIVPGGSSQETTDGGATWHAYTSDYTQAAPIAPEIVFGDANVGYATVRGAVQRTIDGGAHWATIKTPGT